MEQLKWYRSRDWRVGKGDLRLYIPHKMHPRELFDAEIWLRSYGLAVYLMVLGFPLIALDIRRDFVSVALLGFQLQYFCDQEDNGAVEDYHGELPF